LNIKFAYVQTKACNLLEEASGGDGGNAKGQVGKHQAERRPQGRACDQARKAAAGA
jgi:hypothetical protein